MTWFVVGAAIVLGGYALLGAIYLLMTFGAWAVDRLPTGIKLWSRRILVGWGMAMWFVFGMSFIVALTEKLAH